MICLQCKYYDRGNGYCSLRDQDFAPHAGCDKGRSKWDDEDECFSDDEDEDGDWDNKCKAFTSLEQSRKLTEILPLESADMYYHPYPNDEDWYDIPNFGEANLKYNQLPCWSLAALLNYLREVDYFPEINVDEFEVTMSINYYNEDEARPLAPIHNIKVKAESFIDACVTIIEKLHEQKLL